jgi:hypothetical protein
MTSLESNKSTNVIYTDLSKAFDKVSHSKLLEIVTSYGITGNINEWIRNFLSNRIQQVQINSSISTPLKVDSDVPQGSVMGPLLFLLYVDDATKICPEHTTICLFADDAKLFSTKPDDLQLSLNNLSHFLERRQLTLAVEKCETLTISKNHTDADVVFTIGNIPLPKVSSVRDLGVFICKDLQWKMHV